MSSFTSFAALSAASALGAPVPKELKGDIKFNYNDDNLPTYDVIGSKANEHFEISTASFFKHHKSEKYRLSDIDLGGGNDTVSVNPKDFNKISLARTDMGIIQLGIYHPNGNRFFVYLKDVEALRVGKQTLDLSTVEHTEATNYTISEEGMVEVKE